MDILCDCLKSIYNQSHQVECEIIVVDNASSDGSTDMVRSEFSEVNLIENKTNRGFAAANNQGIAVARGRYILLLNSDTVIMDNAIEKAVAFAEDHPDAAVFGCRVLNPDRTLQRTCFMFPSVLNMVLSTSYLYKLFPQSQFFGREQMTWWDRNDVRQVDVATGCFMLVRREAIEKVGLMDERFFVYGEETDWCYRFKKAGWRILFTPDAQIIHLGGQSSKQAAPAMTLQLRGSVLQFMRKHYSRTEYNIACILVWLFFAIRVPGWFIKYIFTRTQKDYCRMRLLTYLTGMKRLIWRGAEGLCVNS